MTSFLKWIIISGVAIFSPGCQYKAAKPSNELVERHCQSCHLPPSPTELNQQTWQREVLPKMAAKLGLEYGDWLEIEALQETHLFPDSSQISREEWREIVKYFTDNAPPFPIQSESIQPISKDELPFTKDIPELPATAPFITLIHFDSTSNTLFYGNAANKSLIAHSFLKGGTNSIELAGAPSCLISSESGLYVLTMGQVMPHNKKTGTLTFIPVDSNGFWGDPIVLIDDLQRPVHASICDLDQDGKEDIIISSYGNLLGELSWYSDIASENPSKHILSPLPGAIKSVVDDINGDGLPDVMALIAQGDEGVYLFTNIGQGNFKQKNLLRFPSTYGSTFFEWQDIDGDGLKDILYVNGDNGDYFPIVKNFHGVRFFKNNGNMEFEEAFFLEQHGIFKVICHDFDQDLDLDLAAISYFPDYNQRQEESFVFYENQGNLRFKASTFEDTPSGKWLTMDKGDLDQDGDQDIILGSALFMSQDAPSDLRGKWFRESTPIVVLTNSTKSSLAKD